MSILLCCHTLCVNAPNHLSRVLQYTKIPWKCDDLSQGWPLDCIIMMSSGVARGRSRRGHCLGTRGSELSGLESKIHQLKLRSADAMMFFF